jgi:phosphopantothenoylcysteine decarboxylase/phosphopantothenate--cysteine ligase
MSHDDGVRMSDPLAAVAGKRVLVGVSGGIAAYKTPELVRLLITAGARVDVVMTPNAARFVTSLTLQVVSRNPVLTDMFDESAGAAVAHVALADAADVAVVAPATADLLGKLAHGLADDPLTTTLLAVRAPTLLAPAMNSAMWEHPAVGESIARLQSWGYRFVGPGTGFLAEGYEGVGRMAEPAEIAAAVATSVGAAGIARRRAGNA